MTSVEPLCLRKVSLSRIISGAGDQTDSDFGFLNFQFREQRGGDFFSGSRRLIFRTRWRLAMVTLILSEGGVPRRPITFGELQRPPLPGLSAAMLLVGRDNALHERDGGRTSRLPNSMMAMPSVFFKSTMRLQAIRIFLCGGKSICVSSPVMTAFEPWPSRVRNISILLGRRVFAPRRG